MPGLCNFETRYSPTMKADELAAITRRVIQSQGFAEFAPTACFPERRDIRTLAGVPYDEDHASIATDWAADLAMPNEEYLVAFKHSASQFKIMRCVAGQCEHHIYPVEA